MGRLGTIAHDLIILTAGVSGADQAGVSTVNQDKARALEGVRVGRQRLDSSLAAYEKQPKTASAKKTTDELKKQATAFNQILSTVETPPPGNGAPPPPPPGAADPNVVMYGIQDAATKLNQIAGADAQQAATSAHAAYRRAQLEILGALLAGGLIAFVLALLVSRSITRRLHLVVETMTEIAVGDLTRHATVEGTDEIATMARAVNEATSAVRDTVGQLAHGAKQLGQNSGELGTITEDIGKHTQVLFDQAYAADSAANADSRAAEATPADGDFECAGLGGKRCAR